MNGRLSSLDGLRGIAALWVLIGHTMILTGVALPVIVNADLGVDLFILLSGFLMVYQCDLRSHREDWQRFSTWLSFWLRRFFRLSPLYYVVLFVGLALGSGIYHDRMIIDHFVGHPPQLPERYLDPSPLNFGLHLTYLFGFLPEYAFRTPLPDWSLGLEMQFYLAFPMLVLLARRVGWVIFSLSVIAVVLVVNQIMVACGVYFPMPTLLPLKLHMFVAGMLVAGATATTIRRKIAYLAIAIALAMVPIGGIADAMHTSVRVVLAAGFFLLVNFHSVPTIRPVSRILGSKLFFWLGELSYGVYLIHLLVLHAVSAFFIQRFGDSVPRHWIFMLTLSIGLVVIYSIAGIAYSAIEKPGQTLGRSVIRRVMPSKISSQSKPEELAAP